MKLLQELVKQISREEGFAPGNRAWRNNNPGNLDAGPRSITKDTGGYAVYAKISFGFADLEDLVAEVIQSHPAITLRTFIAGQRDAAGAVIAGGYEGYAPSDDPRGKNDCVAYSEFLARALSIPIDDPLSLH